MATKIEGWKTTCNRFVAFLDIMGFKDRVFREKHEDTKKLLESLRPAIKTIENEAITPTVRQKYTFQGIDLSMSNSSIIYPITFSDSIILISYDESDISALFTFSCAVMILAVAFEEELPMKGAIAFGEMTADIEESLYFGKPLIDAFELQDELQLYGVVLHHTCEKHINEPVMFKDSSVNNYLVPMKSGGRITHHILDWTSVNENENHLELVSRFYNSVSGAPRIYVDNTMEFVNWVIARKTELGQEKSKP